MPGQNAVGFTSGDALEHVVKDRAARCARTLRLFLHVNDAEAEAFSQACQFLTLRFNREDLAIFVLRRFPAIGKILIQDIGKILVFRPFVLTITAQVDRSNTRDSIALADGTGLEIVALRRIPQ